MFAKLRKQNKPFKNYNTINFDIKSQRDELAPVTPSRILITGHTGSGKSNLVSNLIYDFLPWTRLYINAKDLSEPLYDIMQTVLERVKIKEKREDDFYWFNNSVEGIPDIDSLDKKHQNLIIFDDFITEKSAIEKINTFFIRGRKKNATIIYLSQSYYDVPKIIRLQCNYLLFFKCSDNREINNIYQNHGMGLDKKKFFQLFQEATKEPYDFFMLDLHTNDENKRIRKNFDSGYKLN